MFESRWYQQEALESVVNYVQNNKGNPLVAAPTGTGKSVMIAMLMQWIVQNYPKTRIMMLTHVKELIEQDYEEIMTLWPQAPAGIYSAGLKRRDRYNQIVFAGVKSVLKEIERSYEQQADVAHINRHFGARHVIIVDEAHLISPNDSTTYRKVFAEFLQTNPKLRVIGYTATPYRLGQGMLTEGKTSLFDDVCFDLCSKRNINRLITEGYLSNMLSRPVSVSIDTTDVEITGWDYNNSQLAQQIQKVMLAALRETCQIFKSSARRSCMVFCASVENCETAVQMLRSFGFTAECTHSKKKAKDNDQIIKDFKQFKYQFLVNNNKLTTGFNHRGVDLICMLRSTVSPGLWAQILGRGSRPFENKTECIVLDYGNNIARLGPFNDIRPPKPKGDKTGDAPVKICPQKDCQQLNHAAARECAYCGHKFPVRVNFESTASTDNILSSDLPIIKDFDVKEVYYNKHQKAGKKPCIKVSYLCGADTHLLWLFPEHGGKFASAFSNWWWQHSPNNCPATVDEALGRIGELRTASRIEVDINKKYPEIKNFYFD